MNYYHRTNICEHCGRFDERHIGKASGGWRFHWQATHTYDDGRGPQIRSVADWRERLKIGAVFNEYDEQIDTAEFLDMALGWCVDGKDCVLEAQRNGYARDYDYFHDEDGNCFSGGEFS